MEKKKNIFDVFYIKVFIFLQKDQLGDVPKLDIPITKQDVFLLTTLRYFISYQLKSCQMNHRSNKTFIYKANLGMQ